MIVGFSLVSSGVLMLKVALYAVLLVILFGLLFAHYAAKLVDRKVKLSCLVAPFDAEVTADKSHSVEFTLDLLNL